MDRLDMSLEDCIAGAQNDTRSSGGKAPRQRTRGSERVQRPQNTPYSRPEPAREGEGFKNHGGYAHLSGMTLDDIASAPSDQRVLKVGQASNAKTVAGSIAYVARNGGPPALLALGNPAVNQAIKAVAIGSKYLAEDFIQIACAPTYRDDKRSSVSLVLQELKGMTSGKGREAELLTASSTDPRVLAGAIAGKVRDGERHSITAMGVDCVATMVYAVAVAREYLAEDGLECFCVPEFIHVEKDGEEKSALKLKILWKAAGRQAATQQPASRASGGQQQGGRQGGGGGSARGGGARGGGGGNVVLQQAVMQQPMITMQVPQSARIAVENALRGTQVQMAMNASGGGLLRGARGPGGGDGGRSVTMRTNNNNNNNSRRTR